MSKIKNFIIKYKFQIILTALFIISIISIYIQDKDRKASFNIDSTKIENSDAKIGVYISGEIKKEGVYYLDKDSRIVNLIDIAGGVTDKADVSKINPAQKLNDSDKIIIPAKKETSIEEEIEIDDENDELKEKPSSSTSDKININSATKSELMTLNGIGDATATKIINYRKTNTFKEIEDIMNVPGIGESKFNNIKDDICV